MPVVRPEEPQSSPDEPERSEETVPSLDAARSTGISGDLSVQRAIAADRSAPLAERLEAFDDIIDSEVGDTTMTRARNLERDSGLRQIWIKFDGGNPTGTQKDRIAFAQVRDALRRGFEEITVATCGNYGAALALASSMAGLTCRIYLPHLYHTRRIEEMEAAGTKLERLEGDYEAAVAASSAAAAAEELYDANPGGTNASLQLDAYADIANEIYDELRDAPAAVAVPVSNGTTLAGIHKGFVRLYRRGRTSRMPHLVAGSSSGKNPIIRAWVKNLPHCEDLAPETIRETAVNEPLINWHAFDGELALEAIRDTDGWAGYASDREMVKGSRWLREQEGFNVLPASTAGLSVLLARHTRDHLPGDRYVAVLTGRR